VITAHMLADEKWTCKSTPLAGSRTPDLPGLRADLRVVGLLEVTSTASESGDDGRGYLGFGQWFGQSPGGPDMNEINCRDRIGAR
jgi:hypothetical protein